MNKLDIKVFTYLNSDQEKYLEKIADHYKWTISAVFRNLLEAEYVRLLAKGEI
jgi:hypothetical protein